MAPNSRVMAAIEALNYRATVGDLAAESGVDLATAERELTTLAATAGGHLQVSTAGEIVYGFDRNFRTRLLQRSWWLRTRQTLQGVWRGCFFVVRLSFGVVLVVLLVAVTIAVLVATVLALAAAIAGEDNDVDFDGCGDGLGGCGDGFGDVGNLLLWVNWDPGHGGSQSLMGGGGSRSAKKRGNSPNFLESVYSFLFGCGHPNPHLEEVRWQAIGRVIRHSGGAIAAEQVAPFLDGVGDGDLETEDYMLPVLVRLDGRPEVSDRGELVYRFPSLQVTAARDRLPTADGESEDSQKKGSPTQDPQRQDFQKKTAQKKTAQKKNRDRRDPAAIGRRDYLEERPWRFSNGSIAPPLLCGLTLWGLSLLLKFLMSTYGAALGANVGWMGALFTIAIAYSSAFLLIPLVRSGVLWFRNRAIARRNQQRYGHLIRLRQGLGAALEHKLDFARTFADRAVISDADIAYRSDRDLVDQEADNPELMDREWQERIDRNRRDRSD